MHVLHRAEVILLFAAVIPVQVCAEAEIRLTDQGCDVMISGQITAADAEELVNRDCTNLWVYLTDSPGGDVAAGMKIGRWARINQATTIVTQEDGYCYSTCALVFIAGVERINSGVIGLHRPYLAGAPQAKEQIPALVAEMRDDIRKYVSEMGVNPEFASTMLGTVPENMRLYNGPEIHDLVAERDPIYDEMQVASNAVWYGISTEEYRRRNREAEVECDLNKFIHLRSDLAPAILHQNCQRAVLWGLRESVYLRRSESVSRICEPLLNPVATQNTEQQKAHFQECRIAVMRGVPYDASR